MQRKEVLIAAPLLQGSFNSGAAIAARGGEEDFFVKTERSCEKSRLQNLLGNTRNLDVLIWKVGCEIYFGEMERVLTKLGVNPFFAEKSTFARSILVPNNKQGIFLPLKMFHNSNN